MTVQVGDWVEYKDSYGTSFLGNVAEVQGDWIYLDKQPGLIAQFICRHSILEVRHKEQP
jgi:hypothetical protein